jgi:hypothetical protein
MTKSFTVHYTIHNLASKTNNDLLIDDGLFDFEKEFADVFQALDILGTDVRQEVVENILNSIPEIK